MTPELIEELVRLAGLTAEEIAGVPDAMVAASLAAFRDQLEAELAEAIGPEGAALVIAQFMNTVAICKAEIERSTPQLGTVH